MAKSLKAHCREIGSAGGRATVSSKTPEEISRHASYMGRVGWFKRRGGKIYKTVGEYKEQNSDGNDYFKIELVEKGIRERGYYAEDKDKISKII